MHPRCRSPCTTSPNWLIGLLISGGWVVVGLAGYLLFHRVCRVSFSSDEKALATALLAVVATVNSLLMVAVGLLSWSLGLVFSFVAKMDRPVAGKESIGPEPIEEAVRAMGR